MNINLKKGLIVCFLCVGVAIVIALIIKFFNK